MDKHYEIGALLGELVDQALRRGLDYPLRATVTDADHKPILVLDMPDDNPDQWEVTARPDHELARLPFSVAVTDAWGRRFAGGVVERPDGDKPTVH